MFVIVAQLVDSLLATADCVHKCRGNKAGLDFKHVALTTACTGEAGTRHLNEKTRLITYVTASLRSTIVSLPCKRLSGRVRLVLH